MQATSFKLTALALVGLLAMDIASAQTAPAAAPKAPEPDYTVSYNIGVVSDYRYRAISQSTLKPALQGGVDFAHKNGLYAGAWASTVKWVKDVGVAQSPAVDTGSTSVEVDLYGGYKFDVAKDVSLDLGAIKYMWPGNKIAAVNGGTNADTFEIYGAITSGMFTAKYSRSTTSLFGTASATTNSKGSSYLEAAATIDLAKGWTLVPHIGRQNVKNFGVASYTDYAVTLNKDVDGVIYGISAISTSAQKDPSYAYVTSENKNTAKGAVILSIKKNF